MTNEQHDHDDDVDEPPRPENVPWQPVPGAEGLPDDVKNGDPEKPGPEAKE